VNGQAGADAVVVVLTSLPDAESAARIAATVVGERLAACVNIGAPGTSVYRWQGVIETATEVAVLFKTCAAVRSALISRLAELHPYEVPEILAWTPDEVANDYAHWVRAQTGHESGD
jgi:periplasmic divalent cation tolerance protein